MLSLLIIPSTYSISLRFFSVFFPFLSFFPECAVGTMATILAATHSSLLIGFVSYNSTVAIVDERDKCHVQPSDEDVAGKKQHRFYTYNRGVKYNGRLPLTSTHLFPSVVAPNQNNSSLCRKLEILFFLQTENRSNLGRGDTTRFSRGFPRSAIRPDAEGMPPAPMAPRTSQLTKSVKTRPRP